MRATDTPNSSGTQSLVAVIGTDRAAAVAEMLAQLNARRAAIGVPLLTLSASLSDMAENWSDHLAAQGGSLVHQSPLPAGVYGENLSATCNSSAPTSSPAVVGDKLTSGWLSEKHSYAEWAALKRDLPMSRFAGRAKKMAGQRGCGIPVEVPSTRIFNRE